MRIRTAGTAALLLSAGLTPLALTAPAQAATAALPYDFNGDGRRDLAVGAPDGTVAGKSKAGYVTVVYSTAGGVSGSAKHRTISQNTTGIPGTAETGDAFGASLTSADLNRDGYADLVIGAPGEDTSDDSGGGTAAIIWGSSSGLAKARTLVNYDATDNDHYGQALTTGDFDGDGDTDIAVGSTGNFDIGIVEGPFTKTGAFNGGSATALAYGSKPFAPSYGVEYLSSGDVLGSGSDALVIHGRAKGTDDSVTVLADARIGNYGDWLVTLPAGYVSSVGDIDGDGHADIAVGNHRETSADPSGALGGKASVVYGGVDGLDTSRAPVVLTQTTPGVPGTAASGDRFGSGVALGDIDGDGYADLAVGASYESVGSATTTGTATVLRGTAGGLTTTGAKTWSQSTSGVPGASENGDHFGARLLLTDLTGDGRAELTVSGPGENSATGAIWSLRGGGDGLTASHAVTFGPSALNAPAAKASFGRTLSN
jgi:hypothetical protein